MGRATGYNCPKAIAKVDSFFELNKLFNVFFLCDLIFYMLKG